MQIGAAVTDARAEVWTYGRMDLGTYGLRDGGLPIGTEGRGIIDKQESKISRNSHSINADILYSCDT